MTIKEQITSLEKHFDRKFVEMKTYVDDKIAPLHDYFIGQDAINKNQSTVNKGINIDPKVYDLIKWLVLIIGTIVGAKIVK